MPSSILSKYPLFTQQALINGQWVNAQTEKSLDVLNPATGKVVGTVPDMAQADTEQAIEAAQSAFNQWRKSTAKERYTKLIDWYQLMLDNQQQLAEILVIEQGKPLAEAKGEVAYAANFIQWFAEQGKRISGWNMNHYAPTADLHYTKEPVGVVGVITPWNFPLAMITRKVAPAIAAGCSVVIKPSELTPYSCFALAKLAQQAGFPDGLINIITSSDAPTIGETLTKSTLIKKISFTGSTNVGKILMRQCADTVKRISLELGGNAPFIIFDDADPDIATSALMTSKFRNAGQTCVCANRILIQKGIQQQILERLSDQVSQFKLGNGLDDGVTMGPLINKAAIKKVQHHVDNSLAQGANLICGGQVDSAGELFYQPTILTNADKDSIFCCEETFGPVAPIITFEEEEEAIAIANDTEFGLAAYFCSQDYRRIRRVNNAIESGMIGINEGVFSNEFGPFGGIKQSGIGREGSELGIDEYLEIKYSLLSFK